jgi:NADH-quinone oxidoreductase subunit N
VTGLVSLDWLVLAPVLLPGVGAVLVLLADAIAPRLVKAHFTAGLVALLAGLALAVPGALRTTATPLRTLCLPAPDGACLYEAGPLASALQLGALGGALVVLLLIWPDRHHPTPRAARHAEAGGVGSLETQRVVSSVAATDAARQPAMQGGPAVLVALLLAATAGATGVAAAHDLGSWLVFLELATLPAIALVALRGTPSAGTGSLALLTTSLVSFAMVALGAALWLAATGEAVFAPGSADAALADRDARAVLLLSVLLLLGGLGFKMSLVPFHAWTPQAYAGGSEPVAAFLAGTSKVAALAALLVVLRPLAEAGGPFLLAIAVVSAASMTLGNVLALVQDDPVRLLAWSTVAQAGWVVLPLAAVAAGSAPAAGGYLLAYVIATLVAFTVVTMVGPAGGAGTARPGLAAYTGLVRARPLLGGALALALLSLAGLPPAVVGLVAKVVALRPVVADGLWLLALIAVANAVLGIAVYVRWLAVLLRDTGAPGEAAAASTATVSRPALAALVLGLVALVATSLMPQLLLGLLD